MIDVRKSPAVTTRYCATTLVGNCMRFLLSRMVLPFVCLRVAPLAASSTSVKDMRQSGEFWIRLAPGVGVMTGAGVGVGAAPSGDVGVEVVPFGGVTGVAVGSVAG